MELLLMQRLGFKALTPRTCGTARPKTRWIPDDLSIARGGWYCLCQVTVVLASTAEEGPSAFLRRFLKLPSPH